MPCKVRYIMSDITVKEKDNVCLHAKKCGGCQLQNMTYPQQLAWKQKREQILLDVIGVCISSSGESESKSYSKINPTTSDSFFILENTRRRTTSPFLHIA